MSINDKVKKTGRAMKNHRSSFKRTVDKGLDTILTAAGVNVAGVYALGETINQIAKLDINWDGGLILGTYALWGVGQTALNIWGLPKVSKFWKDWYKKRGPVTVLSYIKTLAAASVITATTLSSGFQNNLDDMKLDWQQGIQGFSRQDERAIQLAQDEINMDITPSALEDIIPQYLASQNILETSRTSMKGKFLRTARWDNILKETEERYSIPEGLLAGLAMRESYGNPLELNSGADGGAGLFMFQPGTAREVGLDIYGKSTASGRDRNHGLKLRQLGRSLNWDYEQMASADERFDVVKSADAAARYLVKWYEKFGSWDKALSAYNRGPGRVARNPRKTNHVKMTRAYQRYYLDQKQKLGQNIDEVLLAQLQEENGFSFKYMRKNTEGRDVFEYEVSTGDNATVIADNFNRWDQKRGDKYQNTIFQDVVDKNRNFIGNNLKPKQKIYILARSKI